MTKTQLIVYVKNPIPGKVKTRLASEVGDTAACDIYQELLRATVSAVKDLPFDVTISYYDAVSLEDIWNHGEFVKVVQKGKDLGERMAYDFKRTFENGYEKVCLIGSDTFEMSSDILVEAMNALDEHDCVLGPALDGGYYLIGFTQAQKSFKEVFEGINWSTDKVLDQTLSILKGKGWSTYLLPILRDIDTLADLNAARSNAIGMNKSSFESS